MFFYVSVPPEMLEGPGEVEGIEGEEAIIRCRASGMPAPTFSFFKVLIISPTQKMNINKSAFSFIRQL